MGSLSAICFFSPKNENEVKTWAKLANRVFVDSSGKKKTFQVSKYTKISNYFEYCRPAEGAPNPTLFFKVYEGDAKVGVKRKAPTSRKENIEEGTSIRDQKSTTRERAAARNTIRFTRASPTLSIFIKASGRTNLFNVW